MGKFLVTRHSGKRIGEYEAQEAAIAAANADAERYGHRCNVYPIIDAQTRRYVGETGTRIVSCYPRAMVWEADIAGLDHNEYMATHRSAARGISPKAPFVDVSVVREYGLDQKLSTAIRCF